MKLGIVGGPYDKGKGGGPNEEYGLLEREVGPISTRGGGWSKVSKEMKVI